LELDAGTGESVGGTKRELDEDDEGSEAGEIFKKIKAEE